MIRAVIVDDNASFLDVATSVLNHDEISVVGTASTIEQALQQTTQLRPDAILVDIMLGEESGFDLARRLAEAGSEATVIFISTHAEADFAEMIGETTAAGFVSKSELSVEAVCRLVSERRGK